MFESFKKHRFRSATLAVIEQANAIIAEFMAQGFVLTLRQLYYQFVARDLIENRLTEYKRLGTIIRDGRRAGLIDWAAIEDRTRRMRFHASWSTPANIIDAAAPGDNDDDGCCSLRPPRTVETRGLGTGRDRHNQTYSVEASPRAWRSPHREAAT